jgi:hypothetical protein
VLSFSLRSPLTEPPSMIDVAHWPEATEPECPLFRRCRRESRRDAGHGISAMIRDELFTS